MSERVIIVTAKHVQVIEGETVRKVPAIMKQSMTPDGKFRPCRRLSGGRWVVTKRYIRLEAAP
jgi:hypothetical protein